MEHLKLTTLMSVNDEIEWIANLLLINQSYHILHHFNYMKRISAGNTEKFEKLQERMEKERLEILNQLMEIKNINVSSKTSNSSSDPNDENQPKRRGRKPKDRLPSIEDLISKEIK